MCIYVKLKFAIDKYLPILQNYHLLIHNINVINAGIREPDQTKKIKKALGNGNRQNLIKN